jgi:hypothetical protein
VITKDQLAASLTRECDICRHLFTKLGPAAHDYRPSPGQRSTTDLLRYLSYCGIAGVRSMAEKNWKIFAERAERAKEMPAAEFPAAMDRQKREIEAFFESVSDQTLGTQEAQVPGGGTLPLGAAIMSGPLKWLTAYKMQLFLYAKATGADIGTVNAWAGIDRPA